MGYHLVEIARGKYGQISKIEEELLELKDASSQGNRIMELIELSDMVGAISGYLGVFHPSYTINDLIIMAKATERAFKDGTRKPRG
jgi:hypothetical protein